jgi:hypothetical protein
METITLWIGTAEALSNGQTQDNRRAVEFEGESLGSRKEYGYGRDGQLTDTRGTVETLYSTADGRLVVHVREWSHWRGEPTIEHVHHIGEHALQPGGEFEALGSECGYGRPLTLDEALASMGAAEEA